ncbi:MAG: metallophosphoesterase family protein [Planctomycetes bacterium]|nr:metallophosphoesterase family protein [Planctomycetota bacterium]
MRIALISDLHSNREALDAVFADIDGQHVDAVLCLGDVVGYGPEPEYCVDVVRQRCQLCLMGNHDEALFRDASDFNPHARGAIEFTRERMQPAWWSSGDKKSRWKYLKGLPLSHTIGRFLFVHGSPRDPVREYVLSTDGYLNPEKLRAVFDSFEGVALGGHTHHPGMHDENLRFHGLNGADSLTLELPADKRFFINVGSVGQPRDADNRACYAILEDERITWRRVPYNFQITAEKIVRTGALSEVLARRLAMGK